MNDIAISAVTYESPMYQQIFELRDEVLRKPLGMSLKNDDLSRDKEDVFFIAEHKEKVIGCVLLHELANNKAQLRAMAVYEEWQGKGIGKKLVTALEEYAWKKGHTKLVLHARKVALAFYSGMGYTISSEEFTEVGIPHYMMEKYRKPV